MCLCAAWAPAAATVGLCPFHQEKTPSFNVNQAHQFYKCFGCGAGGDIIQFVMEIDGLTFPEALKLLAERAGIASAEPRTPEAWRTHRHDRAAAEFFGRAARALAEEVLDELSGNDLLRFDVAPIVEVVRRGGPGLLALYEAWKSGDSHLTASMVAAGRRSDIRAQRRAAEFIAREGLRYAS